MTGLDTNGRIKRHFQLKKLEKERRRRQKELEAALARQQLEKLKKKYPGAILRPGKG